MRMGRVVPWLVAERGGDAERSGQDRLDQLHLSRAQQPVGTVDDVIDVHHRSRRTELASTGHPDRWTRDGGGADRSESDRGLRRASRTSPGDPYLGYGE